MRKVVLKEIEKFKRNEYELKTPEWSMIFFGRNTISEHVSKVDFEKLSDSDLLRFLLYLTMQHDNVIDCRIRTGNYINNENRE